MHCGYLSILAKEAESLEGSRIELSRLFINDKAECMGDPARPKQKTCCILVENSNMYASSFKSKDLKAHLVYVYLG